MPLFQVVHEAGMMILDRVGLFSIPCSVATVPALLATLPVLLAAKVCHECERLEGGNELGHWLRGLSTL